MLLHATGTFFEPAKFERQLPLLSELQFHRRNLANVKNQEVLLVVSAVSYRPRLSLSSTNPIKANSWSAIFGRVIMLILE